MSRLSTTDDGQRTTECEDRARIMKQNSQYIVNTFPNCMGEVKIEVRVLGVAADEKLQLEHDKEQQHHCHVF